MAPSARRTVLNMGPADLHGEVERAFDAGDVETLVSLYEPEAPMIADAGTVVTGRDAIRSLYAGL